MSQYLTNLFIFYIFLYSFLMLSVLSSVKLYFFLFFSFFFLLSWLSFSVILFIPEFPFYLFYFLVHHIPSLSHLYLSCIVLLISLFVIFFFHSFYPILLIRLQIYFTTSFRFEKKKHHLFK